MCYLTIFTPTYNRAHTLHRVYESLKTQTYRDFEWIIVDDGSTDNTKDLVDQWKGEDNFFDIRYFYQTNQGKHIATNYAVSVAKGEMFITLDSDDGCKKDAFKTLLEVWETVPENLRENYKGVACRCATVEKPEEIIGTPFNVGADFWFDSNDNDIHLKHKITSELWGMSRIQVLRKNPYPVVKGLHFYPESVYWGRIGSKYTTRYTNLPLRLYYIGFNEQVTGANNLNFNELYYQREYYLKDLFNDGYFKYAPKSFFKQAIGLVRDGLLSGRRGLEIIKVPDSIMAKALVISAFPFGFALYIKKKLRKV